MEHEDDSESEIVQLIKSLNLKTYILDYSKYSIADIIIIHSCNGLHTCKKECEDDRDFEIISYVK